MTSHISQAAQCARVHSRSWNFGTRVGWAYAYWHVLIHRRTWSILQKISRSGSHTCIKVFSPGCKSGPRKLYLFQGLDGGRGIVQLAGPVIGDDDALRPIKDRQFSCRRADRVLGGSIQQGWSSLLKSIVSLVENVALGSIFFFSVGLVSMMPTINVLNNGISRVLGFALAITRGIPQLSQWYPLSSLQNNPKVTKSFPPSHKLLHDENNLL
jgi:hypothetical protein